MRCPRHGLATASDGKCVRCRRDDDEAAAAAGEPAGPSSGPRIAAIVAGALVVGGGVLWAVHSSSTPTAITAVPAGAPYVPPSAPPLAPLEPAAIAADPTAAAASSPTQTPLERATHLAKITLYSRPASPDCARARTYLVDHGYVFRERDVDADGEAQAAWKTAFPDGTLPALDIDGQRSGGDDPRRIQAALDYAGARRLQR